MFCGEVGQRREADGRSPFKGTNLWGREWLVRGSTLARPGPGPGSASRSCARIAMSTLAEANALSPLIEEEPRIPDGVGTTKREKDEYDSSSKRARADEPETDGHPPTESATKKEEVVEPRGGSTGSIRTLPMRWFFVGRNDTRLDHTLVYAELKKLEVPGLVLSVNPYEKVSALFTWDAPEEEPPLGAFAKLVARVRSPEVAHFPAEYAVFLNRKLEGMDPFDPEKFHEANNVEDDRAPGTVHLYGLSMCGGPLGTLPADLVGTAPAV